MKGCTKFLSKSSMQSINERFNDFCIVYFVTLMLNKYNNCNNFKFVFFILFFFVYYTIYFIKHIILFLNFTFFSKLIFCNFLQF